MFLEPKISFCMIVKNEEFFIEECLKNIVALAYEIIVIDTGSTDNTKAIASKYAKVYDYTWQDDFSHARNYSLSLATGDWVFILDADELLTEKTKKLLFPFIKHELDKKEANTYHVYYFKNINKAINNNAKFGYYKRTLFRNNLGIKFFRPIHEEVFHPDKDLVVVNCNNLELIHRDHEIKTEEYQAKNDYYENLLLKAIRENPNPQDNYYYYDYLANAYKLRGDYLREGEILEKMFKMYVETYPEVKDNYYQYLLMLLINHAGLRATDNNKLKNFLDLMLSQQSYNIDAIFFLALYYERIGKFEMALKTYKNYISLIEAGNKSNYMNLLFTETVLKNKALERVAYLTPFFEKK